MAFLSPEDVDSLESLFATFREQGLAIHAAAFCATLMALPYEARTWFIGNKGMQPLRSKVADCAAASTGRRK